MYNVRIYEMPSCKMVSSGVGMFGEEKFDAFDKWFSTYKRCLFPKDFLYWTGNGFVWLYMYEEGMNVPEEFEIIDFQGGLYAVATGIDQQTEKDAELMNAEVDNFLNQNGFERDVSRPEMCNVITSPFAQEIMGYEQMDYYFPVNPQKQ